MKAQEVTRYRISSREVNDFQVLTIEAAVLGKVGVEHNPGADGIWKSV
jgi:hypothetical protein